MLKLTPTQLDVLRRIREGEPLRLHAARGTFYHERDGIGIRRRHWSTCWPLFDAGLIRPAADSRASTTRYELTDAGRAALAAAPPPAGAATEGEP
jgi:hypothetical protein